MILKSELREILMKSSKKVSMQFVQLCRQTTREENNHTNWSLTYLLIAQKALENQYVPRHCLVFSVHQCS